MNETIMNAVNLSEKQYQDFGEVTPVEDYLPEELNLKSPILRGFTRSISLS